MHEGCSGREWRAHIPARSQRGSVVIVGNTCARGGGGGGLYNIIYIGYLGILFYTVDTTPNCLIFPSERPKSSCAE